MKPEFEDIKKLSDTSGKPLQTVYNEVLKTIYDVYNVGEPLA